MSDNGAALHLGAGGLIVGLAIVGISREIIQHDWSLTLHQWIEALAWPVGGILVAFVGIPLAQWIIKRNRK